VALKSRIFKGNPAFEACLTQDSAHITPGASGDHVAKIQAVVMFLDNAVIVDGELTSKQYGPSTAAAVLNFKKKRRIINPAYQTQADNIVGKMTIQALDDELESRQVSTDPQPSLPCRINTPSRPDFLTFRGLGGSLV
jgi:peptidoglycan hydrolase-like protein with peptidoglycan-binding domain